ncbi:ribosome small subunit-dependent GTPase A [Halosquirtibacter xylanolyticus]|uniref:ribosome small subunit-dependent GTPase A n=1 Tax=Halosquirtibacter xylanolyticus TaxID=3374599 RepID=UPI0037498332|nr:ribosome small subunit-dependent GTPase A [Prolixibacteraceae bacterium]
MIWKEYIMTINNRSYKNGFLGFPSTLTDEYNSRQAQGFDIGRVIEEHKQRYIVETETGVVEAEVIGNLLYTALSREDFPAVGDWVVLMPYDEDKAIIHEVLPRFNTLSRRDHLVATNIDGACIVTTPNRDFSMARLERYVSLCHQSNITPFIVVNKIDLVSSEDINTIREDIGSLATSLFISCVDNISTEELKACFQPTKTYIMLGSSGVGKTSIINHILGTPLLATQEISEKVQRGKHQTTSRHLLELPNGSYLIDNPGVREVGIADHKEGIEQTFDQIEALSSQCYYGDCSHQHERGCAVTQAVSDGTLSEGSYQHYLKLIKEASHYEATSLERKQKGKQLSKLIRKVKNR